MSVCRCFAPFVCHKVSLPHAPIGYNLLVAFLVGIQQAATGIALEARLVWVEHLHSHLLEIVITEGE